MAPFNDIASHNEVINISIYANYVHLLDADDGHLVLAAELLALRRQLVVHLMTSADKREEGMMTSADERRRG